MRRLGTALVLLSSLLAAGHPARADVRDFDQFTYNRLNLEKKLVILDFHTFQCAKCRAQNPLVEKLLEQPRYANVSILQIPRALVQKFVLQFDVSTDVALVFMYRRKMLDKLEGHIQLPVLEQEIRKLLSGIQAQ